MFPLALARMTFTFWMNLPEIYTIGIGSQLSLLFPPRNISTRVREHRSEIILFWSFILSNYNSSGIYRKIPAFETEGMTFFFIYLTSEKRNIANIFLWQCLLFPINRLTQESTEQIEVPAYTVEYCCPPNIHSWHASGNVVKSRRFPFSQWRKSSRVSNYTRHILYKKNKKIQITQDEDNS